MSFDASNRKDIRKAEKAARLADNSRGEFVRHMMSSAQGRQYVHYSLLRSHIFSTSFSPDYAAMAFAEGERNIGLQLLNDLMTYCPDQYVQMQREQNERYNGNDRTSAGNTDSGGELPGSPDSGGGIENASPIGGEYDPYREEA